MLNVGKIENGIVLDHIEAGKAMLIYHYLHLDREDYQVAIIKNARSNDMGRKDILKVECDGRRHCGEEENGYAQGSLWSP